ncbi:hypothetical protein ACTQXK_12360 [Catenibacterium mitsuokai]|uniref:hypothetical protein n=1 Tax=Catenibacterium mitsuokai TaxID=100886 RepID=UPI003F8F0E8B
MQDTIENFFTVDNLNIIMPTLLVICAFGLKIFRKYPPDPIDFVSTFIELPMDIIILALGYISSYICSDAGVLGIGFGIFSVEIVLAIFTFGFCKASIAIYQSTNRTKKAKVLLNRKLYPSDDCKLYYPI